MRSAAENHLKRIMINHKFPGHGVDHMILVANHAIKALIHENLEESKKLCIELAALLHDADDKKIFPHHKNNENSREILSLIGVKKNDVNLILNMINIVSCSENGNDDPAELWMAIPRDCDRLEAIGEIGIQRCKEYSLHVGNPAHTAQTVKVNNLDELWKAATPERFTNYTKGKKSVSEIDHYYDKLLHIGKPECLKSQNSYILDEAELRNSLMIDYILNYWAEHE